MIAIDQNYKPEPYKTYKNRTVIKHCNKIVHQLRQIKDCSLNDTDKLNLKTKLITLIQQSL